MKCINCKKDLPGEFIYCPYCGIQRSSVNMGSNNNFSQSNSVINSYIERDVIQNVYENIFFNYPAMSQFLASTIFSNMMMAEIMQNVMDDLGQFEKYLIDFDKKMTSLIELAYINREEAIQAFKPFIAEFEELIIFFTQKIHLAIPQYNSQLVEYTKSSGAFLVAHRDDIIRERVEAIKFYDQTNRIISDINILYKVLDQIPAALKVFNIPKLIPLTFDKAIVDFKGVMIDLRKCFEQTEITSRRISNILFQYLY
jgi:hypothetical protein